MRNDDEGEYVCYKDHIIEMRKLELYLVVNTFIGEGDEKMKKRIPK